MPRSAIIWTRSRELSLKVRYHRTQSTMISRVKVPPFEEILCRGRFRHRWPLPLQGQLFKFAPEPNRASYAPSQTLGTTIEMECLLQSDITRPMPLIRFQDSSNLKGLASTMGPIFSKIPNPYCQAIGEGLSLLAGLLPKNGRIPRLLGNWRLPSLPFDLVKDSLPWRSEKPQADHGQSQKDSPRVIPNSTTLPTIRTYGMTVEIDTRFEMLFLFVLQADELVSELVIGTEHLIEVGLHVLQRIIPTAFKQHRRRHRCGSLCWSDKSQYRIEIINSQPIQARVVKDRPGSLLPQVFEDVGENGRCGDECVGT
jgi:hypothetical protein